MRSLKWYFSFCTLLALTISLPAQEVTLPPEVRGLPGFPIAVVAKADGENVVWMTPDAGLTVIDGSFFGGDSKKALVYGATNNKTYRLWAVTAKAGKVSPVAECKVVIGAPPPGPGPGPDPVPPDPVPPDPAPNPAPIPAEGFRTLIVYESKDLTSYPASQSNILYTKEIRDYLNSKTVKGADTKTGEWRIWDKDVDATNETKLWQDALKRPRTLTIKDVAVDKYEVWSPSGLVATFPRREEAVALSSKTLPWIVISTGKTGYEGPLPKTVAETLALLKKYGG